MVLKPLISQGAKLLAKSIGKEGLQEATELLGRQGIEAIGETLTRNPEQIPKFAKLYKQKNYKGISTFVDLAHETASNGRQVTQQTNFISGNYTRPDAVENLRAAGADRLSNMKSKPRTIQGPVPPQLADKTFDQGARSYEEAVMAGTTKYIDDAGVAQQIRNYGSDTAPHGRVTKVDVRKMSGRGTEGRLTWEKILTIDKNAKGFYGVKLKGHEHAHHWNPIGVMKRVVEGLDNKTRNQLIAEAQDEFGLYSGNTIFNLRQLPTGIHDKLHKALAKAGYDPKKLKSFLKADYATRKEFLRAFSKVLNDLDEQVFAEVMIAKHGPDWISKFPRRLQTN